jgi:hypothetical protein
MLIAFFDIKGTPHFEFIPQGKESTKFIMWRYWSGYMKRWVEKGLNFGQTIGFSTMTMLQLTRRSVSSSFWPRNWLLKWNTHHPPFPSFVSEWHVAASKNKIYLKVTKVSGYWRHSNEKKSDEGTESCSTTGVPKIFPGLSARVLGRWPLSISCKCTGMRLAWPLGVRTVNGTALCH